MSNTIATNEFAPSPFPLPPPLHRWRTGEGERVSERIQCSPLTCMVAGATLNEESNAEALDTYTACGCEAASSASGLKNLLGGAAPFLIPLAAGFARRAVDSYSELKKQIAILSKQAQKYEELGDFQRAAQVWLEISTLNKKANRWEAELYALNYANQTAEKIEDQAVQNGLKENILKDKAVAYEKLKRYSRAAQAMIGHIKISVLNGRFSEEGYEKAGKLLETAVIKDQMVSAAAQDYLNELNAIRNKWNNRPDKGVGDGQWALNPASARMNMKELRRVINLWTEAAEKMVKIGTVNSLDAASRWHEKVAHVYEALHFDREASKAYAAAAKAILAKRGDMTVFDHERAAELFESATCEDGRDTATFYGAAGRNRWDAAKILAKAGELGRALANVQMAIVDFSSGFETTAQLKTAEEFQTELVERLVQQAPRVQKYFQVRAMASIINEYLKGIEEGWDQLPYEQKLVRMETVQKAVAFALKNHPKELEPFIEEGGGQGRVLNADGCKKAMELWIKGKKAGPMRKDNVAQNDALTALEALLPPVRPREPEGNGMPKMPGRAEMPERPTTIGRGRGERGGRAEGKGRDGREERGVEGRGRARKGLRVR